MFNHVNSTGRLRRWRSLVTFCGSICLCLLPFTSTFAQDEETTAIKPGRSVVRGRVLFADSDQPLRRAKVRLRKELNKDFLKSAISGRRGEFSFQGVAAGTYYVEVDAPGILSSTNAVSYTEFGFSIEDPNQTTVTVDGTNDVKTEIRVTRGGVITGRISYADGEPATHAAVVLYRKKGESFSLFFPDQLIRTDDRGVYRIEGLAAGQYVVGASENNTGRNTFPRFATGVVTAYHPAASSVSSATTINVQLGSETRDVNIKFAEEPLQISGTLKWKQSDAPIKNAVVFLRRICEPTMDLDYRQFTKMVTRSRSDSTQRMIQDVVFLSRLSTNSPYFETGAYNKWAFFDLPPATYVLSVKAPRPVDQKSKPAQGNTDGPGANDNDLSDFDKEMLTGSAEVTLKDKNIENVVIELSDDASIAGSVVVEGGSPRRVAISTKAGSRNGLISLLDMPAYVQEDGSFLIRSVRSGSVQLDITEPSEPNYYVRSITARGIDLMKESLVVAEGEQVSGVQIVLGTDLARIDGRVVGGSGESLAGAGVVIVPVDQRRWNLRSFWGLARADAEGRFSMRLAPGEYAVLSWPRANDPVVPIDSYVRNNLPTARRITLQPNETRPLEVQVSTTAQSNPR
jgi:hypothetical protein